MFDFIPVSSYAPVYYHTMMVITFMFLFVNAIYDVTDERSKKITFGLGYTFAVLFVFYMGYRPNNTVYGDMTVYGEMFKDFQNGKIPQLKKDLLFQSFTKLCSEFLDLKNYFFVIALLYTLPCYLFSKKYAGKFWFFMFFMFVGSFSFWPFGTNGLRNGLATSFFIWGLCYYDKKPVMYSFFVAAFGFHNSMIIPILAFLVATLYKNPKIYLYVWLASIPISLVAGNSLQSIFAGFYGDERAMDYLTKTSGGNNSFRWDFLLYSASAIFVGRYFIFIKKIQDKFYINLFGIYAIANAFWILVIRANFSNRFAYLSWFLMAPIIIYPMLRYRAMNNQTFYIGLMLSLYYSFTYFMFWRG